MLGYIQYSDAPCFHDLVEKSDYKMISIFEVFATNRNEDDFLENIALFATIVHQEKEEAKKLEEEAKKKEEEESDPNIVLIVKLLTDGLIEEAECDKIKKEIKEKNRKVLSVIKFGQKSGDMKDMAHSIKTLCKKL